MQYIRRSRQLTTQMPHALLLVSGDGSKFGHQMEELPCKRKLAVQGGHD
jgi:hypothetical protein